MTKTEAINLYTQDIYEIGEKADRIRREFHQDKVFFNSNAHLNPTNECVDTCKFCGFSAHRKNPNPYTMTLHVALKQVECAVKEGALEIHIVGAHNPKCNLDWYVQLFSEIKKQYPQLHIKALTAAEVNYLADLHQLSFKAVLEKMIQSGVDSMPGGGAEIFDEEVRRKICKGKVDSCRWIDIHRHWHKLGKKSNCTMLFGHIESREHRIDHLLRLQELQEETNGFNAFIPLLFQTKNNFLNIQESPTGQEVLKTIAISRILLHNIPHIKAYWATLGINVAMVAQEFGADDLDGTIQKESIQSASGSKSAQGITKEELISQIKNAGFIPIERDTLYREIARY
ncbi:aminofutalosine synthase MqnE [Helicobacter monodelphidis]|uniref:aminofutalosine synthase MqnE n=1 Tax=Helicobacter sp. 15-1451 TaxID=2004995 RepID=UPI000DCD1015|nr:aminofutalosine synthase MqnE [Helicobacter sp. 15-1451]RAX58825.1 aminofutalosine synthase MqnE [Helicobacter sp. 15-1451]